MPSYLMVYRGIRRDERGRRYVDVSSDAAAEAGVSVLIPLVFVANGEPKSATSNAPVDTASVSAPTASDLSDLLSEAEAILLDSSTAATSSMKAGSSSSVRGSKHSGSMSANGTTGSSWRATRPSSGASDAAVPKKLLVSFAMAITLLMVVVLSNGL